MSVCSELFLLSFLFIECSYLGCSHSLLSYSYAPNAKDLASRDVVSRAITKEVMEGRGVGTCDHPWQSLSLWGVVDVSSRCGFSALLPTSVLFRACLHSAYPILYICPRTATHVPLFLTRPKQGPLSAAAQPSGPRHLGRALAGHQRDCKDFRWYVSRVSLLFTFFGLVCLFVVLPCSLTFIYAPSIVSLCLSLFMLLGFYPSPRRRCGRHQGPYSHPAHRPLQHGRHTNQLPGRGSHRRQGTY
jgi:hypothetical protein